MYDEAFEKDFKAKRAQYEEAIRRNVCEHCIDFGDDNACHKPGGVEQCAVIRNLKEMVYIARAVHADKVTPYIRVLREKVCDHCANTKPGDHCDVREALDCCLDRYLPLVLQAIEDIK